MPVDVALPMLVRNKHQGPTVFTDDGPPRVIVEWMGAGDPDGADLQEVPAHLASSINFRRVLSRGILEIVDASEETQQMLERTAGAWQARQRAIEQNAMATMDHQANNDIIVLPCVGPGPRGGMCNADVPVPEKKREEKPPLCTAHAQLIHQFVLHETDQVVEGKAVKKWIRAGMTAPNAPLVGEEAPQSGVPMSAGLPTTG